MIVETFYKDRPALKIYNDEIEAVFLPEDGGKMSSFKFKGHEFLAQRDGDKYLRLNMDTNYVESECSAFDDMFPTIDPCVIDGLSYPDHGEVCRSKFEYTFSEQKISLKCKARSVNAIFSKDVYFEDNELCIRYEIVNQNSFELPYIWAGHIMFAGEEGAYIQSPYSEKDEITVCFGTPPKKINILEKYGANKEYKFYYNNEKIPMECSVCFPKAQREAKFRFEGDVVKYLGIWMNPGDLNKMYNLAIEPCTAPYDTPIKAERKGKSSVIKPNGKISFNLKIKVGELENV